ncbi:hypothetical protein KO361_06005 [Candidatus Woesearchaeota archaeon]|nr:hypothetical protein [Candidatus Woesearchaeota archaeon]
MQQINYFALYGIVGFLLIIAPTIIEVLRNIYMDITKSVECIFLDTHRKKLVRNYRNKKHFIIKSTEKMYVCSESAVLNKTVFYMSNCAEPIKISESDIDIGKTRYYVDSNEYYQKFNTEIFSKFNASKEVTFIKYTFFAVMGCIFICFLIAYKIGAFSIGG